MTYEDIIVSINHKVENSNFEKFKTPQVVDELNMVLRDLANKTTAFETVEYMLLYPNYQEYLIPANIFRPSRATYRGVKLDFKTQEDMDLSNPAWETVETERELECLVYSNLSANRIIPYPKLTDTSVYPTGAELTYIGQLSDMDDAVYQYLYIHKSSGAKYLANGPYGTIADFNIVEVVAVYGAYLPTKVLEIATDINDGLSAEVELDEVYINALIFGVAGNLLFTSGRTEDISKGERFLQIYGLDETEVGALRDKQFSNSFRDTSRGSDYYRTPFQN